MTKSALAPYSNIRAPVARHPAASDTASSGTRRWTTWVGAAVVGGLTLVVFLPALLNGSVHFDDVDDLPSNLHSQALPYFLALLLTEVAFLVADHARMGSHGIAIDPRSAFANFNLGGALTLDSLGPRAEYERALELLPDRLQAAHRFSFQAGLGLKFYRGGDVGEPQRYAQQAVRLEKARGRHAVAPQAERTQTTDQSDVATGSGVR